MKKIFFIVFILFLSITLLPITSSAGQSNEGWKIDSDMKFNLGYLPPENELKLFTNETAISNNENIERPFDMGFTKTYLADITNIKLTGFIGMGFPVPAPAEPEKYNFFIKLFMFPKSFSPEKSSLPIIEGYLLDKLENGKNLVQYSSLKRNLAVKLCYVAKSETAFSVKKPFPAFIVKKNEKDAQSKFNDNTIFSSLYIIPNTAPDLKINDNELAKFTAGGVTAFHNEIIKLYSQKLIRIAASSEDKNYYFGIKNTSGAKTIFTVIKVPKEPLVFTNWRELPMPQDPSRIFLSGLLLLYKYDYSLKNNSAINETIPAVDSPEFNSQFEKINTHVLEIASVLKLKK